MAAALAARRRPTVVRAPPGAGRAKPCTCTPAASLARANAAFVPPALQVKSKEGGEVMLTLGLAPAEAETVAFRRAWLRWLWRRAAQCGAREPAPHLSFSCRTIRRDVAGVAAPPLTPPALTPPPASPSGAGVEPALASHRAQQWESAASRPLELAEAMDAEARPLRHSRPPANPPGA